MFAKNICIQTTRHQISPFCALVDRIALKAYVEAGRKSDESSQRWVHRYKLLWGRASSAGYSLASDIADQLLRKSQLKADAHG